jgi:hypothetical protein
MDEAGPRVNSTKPESSTATRDAGAAGQLPCIISAAPLSCGTRVYNGTSRRGKQSRVERHAPDLLSFPVASYISHGLLLITSCRS